jgi:predicted MFS family arabinose efflux permease
LVAVALGLAVMGTNIPSPLYGVYARTWGFSEGVITLVFAVYCLVLIGSLLIFGRLSDQIGRRPVVLAALLVIAVGSWLFALAHSAAWLLAARAVQGVAVGMLSGAATAALAELHPEGDRGAAALAATVALTGGSAVGPLFGGLLAEYAPYPLVLPYAANLVLLAAVIVGLWAAMPETVTRKPGAEASLRPRRPRVPAGVRYPFALGSGACFVGWAVAGLFIALVPHYANTLLGVDNLAVGGFPVSLMLGAACVVQVALRKLSPGRAMASGMVAQVAGLAAILVAVPAGSVWWLLAGALLDGAGLGLAFMGGLGLVGRVAPAGSRAEVLSACYVIIYLGESIPVLGVGYGAAWIGLYPAVAAFAAVIGGLGSLVALLAVRRGDYRTAVSNE